MPSQSQLRSQDKSFDSITILPQSLTTVQQLPSQKTTQRSIETTGKQRSRGDFKISKTLAEVLQADVNLSDTFTNNIKSQHYG